MNEPSQISHVSLIPGWGQLPPKKTAESSKKATTVGIVGESILNQVDEKAKSGQNGRKIKAKQTTPQPSSSDSSAQPSISPRTNSLVAASLHQATSQPSSSDTGSQTSISTSTGSFVVDSLHQAVDSADQKVMKSSSLPQSLEIPLWQNREELKNYLLSLLFTKGWKEIREMAPLLDEALSNLRKRSGSEFERFFEEQSELIQKLLSSTESVDDQARMEKETLFQTKKRELVRLYEEIDVVKTLLASVTKVPLNALEAEFRLKSFQRYLDRPDFDEEISHLEKRVESLKKEESIALYEAEIRLNALKKGKEEGDQSEKAILKRCHSETAEKLLSIMKEMEEINKLIAPLPSQETSESQTAPQLPEALQSEMIAKEVAAKSASTAKEKGEKLFSIAKELETLEKRLQADMDKRADDLPLHEAKEIATTLASLENTKVKLTSIEKEVKGKDLSGLKTTLNNHLNEDKELKKSSQLLISWLKFVQESIEKNTTILASLTSPQRTKTFLYHEFNLTNEVSKTMLALSSERQKVHQKYCEQLGETIQKLEKALKELSNKEREIATKQMSSTEWETFKTKRTLPIDDSSELNVRKEKERWIPFFATEEERLAWSPFPPINKPQASGLLSSVSGYLWGTK